MHLLKIAKKRDDGELNLIFIGDFYTDSLAGGRRVCTRVGLINFCLSELLISSRLF